MRDGILVTVETLDDTGARVGRDGTMEVWAHSIELRATEDDPTLFHIRAGELVMGPDGPELLLDFSGLDAAAIAEARVLVNDEPVEAEVLSRSAILWGAARHASCSVTTWAADVDDLPTSAAFRLTEADGTWLAGERTPGDDEGVLSFGQRAVVFLGGASRGEVPAAQRVDGPAALQAAVKLLAVDPESGEEKVVTEGILTGVATTDAGGDRSLHAGGRPGDATVARGDILIGGEPIGIERTVGDQPILDVPPTIQAANGRGNRTSASNHEQTLQAELL